MHIDALNQTLAYDSSSLLNQIGHICILGSPNPGTCLQGTRPCSSYSAFNLFVATHSVGIVALLVTKMIMIKNWNTYLVKLVRASPFVWQQRDLTNSSISDFALRNSTMNGI